MLAKKRDGIPRLLGDYSAIGAVATDKVVGAPVQSIIMKAALLPGFADNGSIAPVARRAGEWLKMFHKATARRPASLLTVLRCWPAWKRLCHNCKAEGLEEGSIQMILGGARLRAGTHQKDAFQFGGAGANLLR